MSLHASYETYAAGLQVAEVEAGLKLDPKTYQMKLGYQTTGMASWLFGGHQVDDVSGSWHGRQAEPARFLGQGYWRGKDRVAEIEYQRGKPTIRQLTPPATDEREPVPEAMQTNTVDTLSALLELIRSVHDTGHCESIAHTYDGRRVIEISAQTVGEEVLQPTGRSSYAGRALRCDFSGHLVAGFLLGDDHTRQSRPLRGSAWLAPIVLGGPPLPVRLSFETRWFGDATMYLTGVGPGADIKIARGGQ